MTRQKMILPVPSPSRKKGAHPRFSSGFCARMNPFLESPKRRSAFMAKAPKAKVPRKKQKRQIATPAQSSSATFPIVAIGASAGGLEAFSNLLRSLPAEPGIALVFIPHLDPTHESAMVEL